MLGDECTVAGASSCRSRLSTPAVARKDHDRKETARLAEEEAEAERQRIATAEKDRLERIASEERGRHASAWARAPPRLRAVPLSTTATRSRNADDRRGARRASPRHARRRDRRIAPPRSAASRKSAMWSFARPQAEADRLEAGASGF